MEAEVHVMRAIPSFKLATFGNSACDVKSYIEVPSPKIRLAFNR